jgi:hypothetical protein
MNINLWLKRIIIIALALWLGAWLEHIKIDINYISEQGAKIQNFDTFDGPTKQVMLRQSHAYMPFDYFFSHASIDILLTLTLIELGRLKWLLTLLAIALFYIINKSLIATFDTKRLFLKPLWVSYLSIAGFSFLFFMVGRLVGFPKEAYAVSREIIGGLQSLVPVMIVYPLHAFISKQDMSYDAN